MRLLSTRTAVFSLVFALLAVSLGARADVDNEGRPDPLDGWGKAGYNTEQYQTGFLTTLSKNGRHMGFIKSLSPNFRSFATLMRSANIEELRGKRILLRTFIKTKNARSVGAWFRVEGKNRTLALDNMSDRRLTGTKDWKEVSLVLDIPEFADTVSYGVLLEGKGQVWFETPTFHIVDDSVRTTNRKGRPLSPLEVEDRINRMGFEELNNTKPTFDPEQSNQEKR